MDRRTFLGASGFTGGVMALAGLHIGHAAYARNTLEKQLLAEADPLLTDKALHELRDLPTRGREEIRTWFHGPCLNAAAFATKVTSDSFRDQLSRVADVDQQRALFLSAFLAKVVSESEILNRISVIAEEVGSELDLNWQECCRRLSDQWGIHVREYGSTLPDDLAGSLEPVIRSGIIESLELARSVTGTQPVLSETAAGIGEAAILLLPLARVPGAAQSFLPVFLLTAVSHLFSYVNALWNRAESIDVVRRAVSARLALLANRIGAEFESEVRVAVGRLHDWQQQAVTTAARRQAEQAIHLI